MINGIESDKKSRIPDPERMVKAYNQAASTQNLLRAFSYGVMQILRLYKIGT